MQKGKANQLIIDTDKIEKSVAANVQVIYEGIYITESLNHLQYFYAMKNGLTRQFKLLETIGGNLQYDVNRVFVQPSSEYQMIFGNKGKILMIPVMKFLESLSGGMITKFITLAALRPDKCENLEVLKFAQEVSLL